MYIPFFFIKYLDKYRLSTILRPENLLSQYSNFLYNAKKYIARHVIPVQRKDNNRDMIQQRNA